MFSFTGHMTQTAFTRQHQPGNMDHQRCICGAAREGWRCRKGFGSATGRLCRRAPALLGSSYQTPSTRWIRYGGSSHTRCSLSRDRCCNPIRSATSYIRFGRRPPILLGSYQTTSTRNTGWITGWIDQRCMSAAKPLGTAVAPGRPPGAWLCPAISPYGITPAMCYESVDSSRSIVF